MKPVLKAIKTENEIMCVAFHPSKDVLVSGDIEGKVTIYSTAPDYKDAKELMDFSHHKKSCRRVTFNREGDPTLFTASSDKSFCSVDLEQGNVVRRMRKAHDVALYSMYAINQNMVATGDDDGTLKLWDMRLEGPVMSLNECGDCITDITGSEDRKVLLATSGEGTLSAFDPRKHKLKLQSELMDAGQQSVAIVKNGEKVVCGGEEGVLSFFNWGEFGNISDRFPGHPYSIEKIIPLHPHLVLTAASDAIRAVSVFPNRIVDIVGDHGGSPVEDLALNHHSNLLASCSHDLHIRFWDVSKVYGSKKLSKKRVAKNKFITKTDYNKREDFFSGLVQDIKEIEEEKDGGNEEDDDGEEDDDDDDGEEDDDGEKEEEDGDAKESSSKMKVDNIDDRLSDEGSEDDDTNEINNETGSDDDDDEDDDSVEEEPCSKRNKLEDK